MKPFTKYKIESPNDSLCGLATTFFADSMDEANEFVNYKLQQNSGFRYNMYLLTYTWRRDIGFHRKSKEELIKSNTQLVPQQ